MAGYSGTPLWQKLGYRAGARVALIAAPEGHDGWLAGAPPVTATGPEGADLVHVFATAAADLAAALPGLRDAIARDGAIWVSWPKKSARVLSVGSTFWTKPNRPKAGRMSLRRRRKVAMKGRNRPCRGESPGAKSPSEAASGSHPDII